MNSLDGGENSIVSLTIFLSIFRNKATTSTFQISSYSAFEKIMSLPKQNQVQYVCIYTDSDRHAVIHRSKRENQYNKYPFYVSSQCRAILDCIEPARILIAYRKRVTRSRITSLSA